MGLSWNCSVSPKPERKKKRGTVKRVNWSTMVQKYAREKMRASCGNPSTQKWMQWATTTDTLAMTRRNSPSFRVKIKSDVGRKVWISTPGFGKLLPEYRFVNRRFRALAGRASGLRRGCGRWRGPEDAAAGA